MNHSLAHATRMVSAIVIASVAGVGLVGCAVGGTSADKSDSIALSLPNYSRITSLQLMVDAAVAEAESRGYTVDLDDPGDDIDAQISTIRSWIPQNYSAIINGATDPTVFEGISQEAQAAGTKWVAYGGGIDSADGAVDLDQLAGGIALGTMAGEWFTENTDGVGKIALLTYEEGTWAQTRRQGIEQGLADTAPGVEVVASADALSETEGLDATLTILQAHPDLSGVLAIIDSAALGAYGALPDKNATMFIGGIDGSPESFAAIEEGGAYRASAALDLVALGKAVADTAIKVAEGDDKVRYSVEYLPALYGSEALQTAKRQYE